ncbi:MAG: 30S ribosomal protein S4 [Phycisphaerae bacterium]
MRLVAPVCRFCRREGLKLFLKGPRCESKCPLEREYKQSPPGMHAWRRGKTSDYGVRLREKQKVKRFYGLAERQFRRIFALAEKSQENTGMALLQLLERRLDNAVFKAGLTLSRRAARQAIAHGHIVVNGRKVDRPGYPVRIGDRICVRGAEKSQKLIRSQAGEEGPRQVQNWLQVDAKKPEAVVISLPTRDDVQIPVEEQLIVEFCSR